MKNRLIILLSGIVLATLLWLVPRQPERTVEMIPPPVAERIPLPEANRGNPVSHTASAQEDGLFRIQNALRPASSLSSRLDAVRNLPSDLSTNEVRRLLELLSEQETSSSKTRGYMLAVKNELLLALRNQTRPQSQLPHALISLFHDKQADIALRDYVIQHLASWYEEILLPDADTPERSDGKQAIVEVLKEGLSETTTSIAGTALLNLHRLAASDPDIPVTQSFLTETASRLAQDLTVDELTRTTAIQISAESGDKTLLPTIIELARSGSSVPLRLSAIAALGTLGVETDRQILESLAVMGTDSRLSRAARIALARLDSRVKANPTTRSI